MLTEQEAEEFRIRQLVEKWALTRDAGDWAGFASVWHEDGWMTATWFQGPAADFIRASRDGFDAGVNILHFLGGSRCEVTGDRAVAQTKMTIQQRAPVHGITADVTCTGRFYDFLEKRHGAWGIVRRQPIYEKDRLDPVDPGARLTLDQQRLAEFPAGYRHLAYLQSQLGYRIAPRLPGLRGPEVERLYQEGRDWRGGSAAPGRPAAEGLTSPGPG
jgi:SnoaL-like domain